MKPSLLKVDFHTHTDASKDSLTTPGQLVKQAIQRGLDRVVVTDHDTVSGALAAREIDPVRIIVGEEIMTSKGELLAAFVENEIPRGLSPIDAIARLREQEAFISVSHPFDAWRSGAWQVNDLLEILPLVDAIEVFNARCMRPGSNQDAVRFAEEHHITGTGGSDAHAAFELGAGYLHVMNFNSAGELRQVIRAGKTGGHPSPFWVHFFSRYAAWKKKSR
jgi:predicted metal-dependent phosphoesterase TrpH